jgi:hypothetical protein
LVVTVETTRIPVSAANADKHDRIKMMNALMCVTMPNEKS